MTGILGRFTNEDASRTIRNRKIDLTGNEEEEEEDEEEVRDHMIRLFFGTSLFSPVCFV